MKSARAAAVAAVLVLAGASYAGGEKVLLKHAYVPGEYLQTMTVEGTQNIQAGERKMVQRMSQQVEAAIKISPPNSAGMKQMTLEYKRFKQTIDRGGQKIAYDSSSAEAQDPNLTKTYGALLKAKISMIIGPDEKIRSVSGLDKMWDELAKSDPSAAQMAAVMKKSMGDREIKDMVARFGDNLPGKAVSAGESWTRKAEMNVPIVGKMAVEMKCALKGVEKAAAGTQAVITIVGKMKADKDHTTEMLGAKMTFRNFAIDMSGENRVDPANPMLFSMTMVQDGGMELLMQVPDGAEQPPPTKIAFKNKIGVRVAKAPSTKPAPPAEKPKE